jgi:hypothetical protein
MLFDYCLFYSGAFYTFSWEGTFCFYIAWGGMRRRIDEKRKRMRRSALFATIGGFWGLLAEACKGERAKAEAG